MEDGNTKFDLISIMVDETFSGAREEDLTNLVQFSDYQKKANDLKYMGAFDEQRQCYMLQVNDTYLEMPVNWSIFSQNNKDISIDSINDGYGLTAIFSEILGSNITKVHLDIHPTYFKLTLYPSQENYQKAA